MIDYKQVKVEYIEKFPKLPQLYSSMDWKDRAKEFCHTAFNDKLKGQYLPLVKMINIDEAASGGYSGEVFTLPSYIGTQRLGYGEALSCIGAVLGASLSGEDMQNYFEKNWLNMCEAYYSSINGHGLVLNGVNASNTCGSFWYDIFPSCLFYHLGSLYPENKPIASKMRDIAGSWLSALPSLYDNWDHTGFSFREMAPSDSGKWVEPDAAIGIAYIEYMAYVRWGDMKFLDAAKRCMKEIEKYTENPYYEILGSYGPYLAARMNSEADASLSVGKFLQYVFNSTSGARPGWGIINERWGKYDAYGLSGSTTDTSGYAFSMNTYTTAGLVAPMVRYAPEYSRAVGRYLLHVYCNSRLYFPDMAEQDFQSDYDWYKDTGVKCISYEGVRNKGKTTPYSTGDARRPTLNFNPYGAWGAGFMAALFDSTNVEGILKIDVLKTDFEHGPAYPTYLYYNPYDENKTVNINPGEQGCDLYDCVSKAFLRRNVRGNTYFTVPADEAVLLVIVPAGGEVSWHDEKMLINGVAADYKGAYESYDSADVAIFPQHLSFKKTVKASSVKSPEYEAANVVDSDWRTRWVPGEGDLQWICVDLKDTYKVNKIKLRWYDKAHASSYKIQVSKDEASWQDAYSTDCGDGGLDTIRLQMAYARYVKLCCQGKGGSEYSLIEFEVYGEAK